MQREDGKLDWKLTWIGTESPRALPPMTTNEWTDRVKTNGEESSPARDRIRGLTRQSRTRWFTIERLEPARRKSQKIGDRNGDTAARDNTGVQRQEGKAQVGQPDILKTTE